jgi:hypothetical protein
MNVALTAQLRGDAYSQKTVVGEITAHSCLHSLQLVNLNMSSTRYQSPAHSQLDTYDWSVLHRTRANALLTGSRTDTEDAMASLLPYLRPPVATWQPSALRNPPLTATGTLIIEEVDALDSMQQQQLLESLDGSGRVQIISVASCPLYPLVESGKFADALYYRLNVVHLDFESSPGV